MDLMVAPDAAALRRARVAATMAMFVLAIVMASWAPRIPEVKDQLGLSDGQLGLALVGAPVGAIVSLWLIGLLVRRYGSVSVLRVILPAYCANGLLIPLVDGLASLFAVLALWGATSGCFDIAVNAQVVEIERHYRRPIMTSAHAAWTAGAFSGAGIGAVGAALDTPLGVQLAVLGGFGLVLAWPATVVMLPSQTPMDPTPMDLTSMDLTPPATPIAPEPRGAGRVGGGPCSRRPGPSRLFVVLGAIAFASYLCEGVAADWSAVYLRDVTAAGAGTAGLGFVAFTTCMFAVRIVGDRLTVRFGPVRTVRVLAALAAVGVAVALALGSSALGTASGIIGFGLLGAGTACVVPSVFSAAGRIGQSAGTSIAAVSSAGYAGWLGGPAAVGGLAELVSLPAAMAVVVLLLGVVIALASALASGIGPPSAGPANGGPAGSRAAGPAPARRSPPPPGHRVGRPRR